MKTLQYLLFLTLTFASNFLSAEVPDLDILGPVGTIELIDGRSVLTNKEGMTLYIFDKDQPGVSQCYDQCAIDWPPLLTDQETLRPPLGVIKRTDGKLQITYDNKPLYLYIQDKIIGDIKGDGVQNVWHMVVVQEDSGEPILEDL